MAIVGYTTGVFDLFHIGHLNVLQKAKEDCDTLIVGVTTDELAYKLKSKKPIIPFAERMEIIRNIRCVDEAVPEGSPSKIEAWEKLKFDRIYKGSDWQGTPAWVALEHEFGTRGVSVKYFDYTEGTSSTILRQALDLLVSVVD